MRIGKYEAHCDWGFRRKAFWFRHFDLSPVMHIWVAVLVFVTVIVSKNVRFEDITIIEQ